MAALGKKHTYHILFEYFGRDRLDSAVDRALERHTVLLTCQNGMFQNNVSIATSSEGCESISEI